MSPVKKVRDLVLGFLSVSGVIFFLEGDFQQIIVIQIHIVLYIM